MSTTESNYIVDKTNPSSRYGMIAGVVMALMLLLFEVAGVDHAPYLKLIKYVFLGAMIALALKMIQANGSRDIFIKGASAGAKLSLIAGGVLLVSNVVIYLLAPDAAFSKYTVSPHSLMQAVLVGVMLLFETVVIGSIITFIMIQYLKGKAQL